MTPVETGQSARDLATQIDSLIRGAEEFKAEHGSCQVIVGPNSPVAKARIERIAGFPIDVQEITLVSRKRDEEDIKVDGPLVYFRALGPEAVTLSEVVRAIDWLGNSEEIQFHSVDWSSVEENGRVYLEGRKGEYLVDAVFEVARVSMEHDWDGGWDDEDD